MTDTTLENKKDVDVKLLNLLNQADNYLNNSEFKQAYDIYHQLINHYCYSPEIYNNLAIAANQIEKFDESLEYIKKAIELAPNNPVYLAQYAQFLSVYYSSDEHYQLAKNIFKQALDISNQINDNYINLQVKLNYAQLIYNKACELACSTKQDLNNLTQAINLFKKSLKLNTNNDKALYNIACCYINLDELNKAVKYLKETIKINPNNSNAHFALSQYYSQLNNSKLSEHHLKLSLDSKNYNQALAEYNYGVIEQQRKNYSKAIVHYANSLKLNPKLFASCYNTASIYHKLKDYNQAIKFYKKSIEINPYDESCKYLLASLEEKTLEENLTIHKAPDKYIENLFDSYADDFEHDLINKLNYKTPELLSALFTKYLNQSNFNTNKFDILDLGCGTGLAAQHITKEIIKNIRQSDSKLLSSNIITNIDGVDISQNMLDKAKDKNIYNNLYKSSIDSFINNHQTKKYNLVILADVLVYYGNLENIFNNIINLLNIDNKNYSYILFSIEVLEDTQQQYSLNHSGRFSHNIEYINRLVKNNFTILDSQIAPIRNQAGQQVKGAVFLLKLQQNTD